MVISIPFSVFAEELKDNFGSNKERVGPGSVGSAPALPSSGNLGEFEESVP